MRQFLPVVLFATGLGAALRPPSASAGVTERAGVVVFEAENFDANLTRTGHTWTVANSAAGFTGSGYIEALPDSGLNLNATWVTASPEVQYAVAFVSNATYQVWVR